VTTPRIAKRLAAVAAVAGAAFLVPATGDWLVTRDGDRIETQGPWRVESRLVVFKRPDGTYASMRLSEIDLEASERLTLEHAEAAKRAVSREGSRDRRESVARLTEKDLPPAGPLGPPREEEQAADAESADAKKASTGSTEEEEKPPSLGIPTWREVTTIDDPGVTFVGEINNPTEHVAMGVTVTVTLYDAEDEEIASTAAILTSEILPPGKNGAFRASFPGRFHYTRAHFDVSAELVLTQRGEEEREFSAQDPNAPPS
jgi:hypothetical protein